MFRPFIVIASFFTLLLTAQMVTITVKCTGVASLCALEFLNSTTDQTSNSATMGITTSNLSIIPVSSSASQTSLSITTFPSILSSSTTAPPPSIISSRSPSQLPQSPSSKPSTTTPPTPPPPLPPAPPQTQSSICLTTGPFCAPQCTPRPPTFHGPQTKSLPGPPVTGTACPTSKDLLLRCGKVGQAPKVEKCKFMGFGWKVHCAESRVGVDSCGGV
ncbi:hypothetical protein DL98DRAFT_589644 [Cadophora sp. DSE1049]|nr:hypothetical protein DL98DRAFT_589644 [Cadophora sp. DSE1049]